MTTKTMENDITFGIERNGFMANILIVEDEKNMQDIIAEYIKKGGHTCFTADDGIEVYCLQNGTGNEQYACYHADSKKRRKRQIKRV